MTTWCRLCQSRESQIETGYCNGLCGPCYQAVREFVRQGHPYTLASIERASLALRRALEAHRAFQAIEMLELQNLLRPPDP